MARAGDFQPRTNNPGAFLKKLAIIGAGLAGLVAANRLSRCMEVEVFEKSRGLGGRMATRRADPFAFDHGAQYFTAKSPAFSEFLEPLMENGVVADWQPRLVNLSPSGLNPRPSSHPCLVAVPGMSAMGRYLAQGIQVHGEWHTHHVEGRAGAWYLVSATGQRAGPFDWVVTATPAVQAAALLPQSFLHHETLSAAKLDACFTVMFGFDSLKGPGFDGAFVEDEMIGWIAVDSSKPGRTSKPSIVVQSRNDWAEANADMPREAVQEILETRATQLTGIELGYAPHRVLHRWLYASTSKPADQPFLLDGENRLAAIGDWCIRGRVEAAFESANAFAGELETRL